MDHHERPSTVAVIFGLVESMIVYFSIGFTTIALASYVDDRAVDVGKSLIVGGALAVFPIARFVLDVLRDARDARKEASQ